MPASAEYNPKALYVSSAIDLQNGYLYNALIQEGFTVTISDTIPENMDEYDLVVVASYSAAWRQTADYMKNYVANGGGAFIGGGVPAFFPYTYTPHSLSQGFYDISYISEWFGTPRYQNVGISEALITIDNPLGTDLKIGDKIGYCGGWGGAAVSNLHPDDTQSLASWTNYGHVAAFTHTYENGRVFYYATGDESENNRKLTLAGALWAADFSTDINEKPIADANGPYTVNEGSKLTFDGSNSYDPDGTIVLYEWDLDSDGQYDDATGVAPYTNFEIDGTFTIGLKVTDNDGEEGFDTSTVIVNNVAPTVSINNDSSAVSEGDPINFIGDFTDPGKLHESYTTEWDFGDGKTSTGTLNPTHVYGDDGVFTVTLTVTDNDGGVGTDTIDVQVNNVAPTVNCESYLVDNENTIRFLLPHKPVGVVGSFTDPGWLDTHTATWDFGFTAHGILTEENEQPDSTGTITSEMWVIYDEPGIYPVTLKVIDDNGGVGTDTKTLNILSSEEAIPIIDDYIQDLPDDVFELNPDQRKNAFSEKFEDVIELIDAGEYKEAKNKLKNDIRSKADGHVDGNLKNDWIIDPEVQREICEMVDDLIAYIETLQ